MNRMIDSYEKRITILFIAIVIVWFSGYITTLLSIRKCNEIKIENARLEQQVKDYKWQLDQVQYIMKYEKGE